MTFSYLQGFLASFGLIVAIGAQNAFVLSHGLRRNHVLAIALICSLGDAMLTCLGVFGAGSVLSLHPMVGRVATYGGAVFVFTYALLSFRSAVQGGRLDVHPGSRATLASVCLSALAVTLLNPHAYLDTVVLLGAIASRFSAEERRLFAFGAVTASFSWFFLLAYGSRLLTPLFRRTGSWRVLDTLVGLSMLLIGTSILHRA